MEEAMGEIKVKGEVSHSVSLRSDWFCPACGEMASDIDDHYVFCERCDTQWETDDPSECHISELLRALRAAIGDETFREGVRRGGWRKLLEGPDLAQIPISVTVTTP